MPTRRCLRRFTGGPSPSSLALAGGLPSGSRLYDVDHAGIGTVLSGTGKRAEAMQRHMTPYNITQNVGTFAMGLAASMEHENAVHYGDYDPSSIVSIKTALMGPLSGIGDSIYWGIVRCIAAGVGIGFAASGSILGPILFLVIYNLPGMLGRYYLTFLGFSMGENFITKAYESGMITILTKCAGIIGLMNVGFMISSNVSLSLALTMPVSGAEPIAVQPYLDSLLMACCRYL